jgi:diaminopimelate epimerase
VTFNFEKWHGLGNDFILVRRDGLGRQPTAEEAMRWCDRRFGVGADGVLTIWDETDTGLAMRIYNSDGSIPEICGNGIRCAVRSWAGDRNRPDGVVRVETGAGARSCCLERDGRVTVDMGPADGPHEVTAELDGRTVDALEISMGNPHLIFFLEEVPNVTAEAAGRLERHPHFPQQTNVSFAVLRERTGIDVLVWERGVGFTKACGTAACAVAAAAVATGRSPVDTPIGIVLPGGALTITVNADLTAIHMTGPAEKVYSGVIA